MWTVPYSLDVAEGPRNDRWHSGKFSSRLLRGDAEFSTQMSTFFWGNGVEAGPG